MKIVRPGKNLFIEEIGLRILEGQVSADHGEQDDTTGPNIHSETIVLFAFYHLRGSIAGRPTGSLELFSLLVGVGKPEVNNPNVSF